jgi:predicted metal-dependent phosphoesterase TrpH
MSLTDHDSVDGWPLFKAECAARHIHPVSGVELSSQYDRTVHVLGYRIERFEPLEKALEWTRERRNERNIKIKERLEKLGLPVTMDDVRKESGGRVIGRPHFAKVLVAKGIASDYNAAFSEYLARGAAAYVAREGLSPEECVGVIREARGLPVLAHPSLTGLEGDELGGLLDRLKARGLWGLECISSHCSSEKAYGYLAIAEKHSLFPTAGSDFHGSVRPNAKLGVQVSDNFLPWARLGVTF